MEHCWILLIAMIGHVLCVFADRLLLCTPGGQFGFSDMKDNERMARLFAAKPESDPLRSIAHFVPVVMGMTPLPAWACVFNLLPLFLVQAPLNIPGAGNIAGAAMYLGLFILFLI